ncbi:Suppressor of fused protein (SUFU) [Chitinophaga sp. YR627]|uniref:suppressor of fused domain protein n=1 Tax=Chitinophaga sp. YR627 TaxID=1881041 RepID=UPI0008EC3D46|nr:suppressor of fused domain protein [Chitinophaga sp. YR627]SFO70171.1 Suppressor of fused protein (SUFU) [Chitinophaga sp. YR627]
MTSNSTEKTPAALYLEHLDKIFQVEPAFYREASNTEGLPGLTAIVYKDIPEKGYTTAFTYGLSLGTHAEWTLGRPELCICVASDNDAWGQVAAYIANRLRGDCPFLYGQTINFGTRISEDSDMDAFFIFAPSILDREEYTDIDVGTDYKINIAGLYPMYADETDAYEKLGLKDFWHHPDYDNYSVNRKKVTI